MVHTLIRILTLIKVGNVDCGVNGKNEVCEVTWLVTVKNGDDSEDSADGTLRGALKP